MNFWLDKKVSFNVKENGLPPCSCISMDDPCHLLFLECQQVENQKKGRGECMILGLLAVIHGCLGELKLIPANYRNIEVSKRGHWKQRLLIFLPLYADAMCSN